MTITKRDLFKLGGGAAALGAVSHVGRAQAAAPMFPNLAKNAVPISVDERRARVARAQALMAEQGIDALLLEAGSAMVYFTGVRWWRSERLTGAVIPKQGEIAFVTPFFEEPSVRESITFGDDVRTWHEHESPFDLVAGILKERGVAGGTLGVEGTVRHFVVDGVANAAPGLTITSGEAVTRGVRMIKSPAEIALMQIANTITLAAYRHVHENLETGMAPSDISTLMSDTTGAMGGRVEFSMVLLNEASAYPHGTSQPQELREGSIVLMDCGCGVEDYESDISRTWVHGEPTKQQRAVWNTVKRGQEIVLETAKVGTPAGAVDRAVRAYYEQEGYGPAYRLPGLSHRTGHGIGLDGHEAPNFVSNETIPLAPGMCFSDEPGIYLPGEFGVRLEDCLYMTDSGPKLFSPLSPSIDKPFG